MYPLNRFWGTVNSPTVPVVPSSSLGASTRMTKPFEFPSVPGQGNTPTVLRHSAEQTLVVKSYPVLTGASPATLISTQIGFEAPAPMPKNCPLALARIQKPRYLPAVVGATILTLISTVALNGTFQGRLTEVGALIGSPL